MEISKAGTKENEVPTADNYLIKYNNNRPNKVIFYKEWKK